MLLLTYPTSHLMMARASPHKLTIRSALGSAKRYRQILIESLLLYTVHRFW